MNKKLEHIYEQIPKPDNPCPPNCGKCCGILWPSMSEIRNIKDWLKYKNREYIEFHMLRGVDCPYLGDNKECTIYPVRPFLCRIMAMSSDLPCPVDLCSTEKPLNHFQSSHLYKEIYLKGKQKPLTEKHKRILQPILDKEINPCLNY